MRKKIKTMVNVLGYNLAKQAPLERQHRLFELVHPWRTEHELIRVGGDGDGGYLLPDDLDGITACFSPGVSDQASFEEDMLARGVRCFQVDASVERSPVQEHPLVQFERKFLGPVTEGHFISLADWVDDKKVDGDLLLQMDIEGAEWLTLAATPDETLKRFRIVCIEFHRLEHLFDQFAFDVMEGVMKKLGELFYVVHIHANNWCDSFGIGELYRIPGVMEYTFIRKDRVRQRPGVVYDFPHRLDRDCHPSFPPVKIHKSILGL